MTTVVSRAKSQLAVWPLDAVPTSLLFRSSASP